MIVNGAILVRSAESGTLSTKYLVRCTGPVVLFLKNWYIRALYTRMHYYICIMITRA